ncbi:Uma2 family endonuclease [Candidatus Thiodictyon syntrophicum]|uniref:Putative restriction endonuclease domain-containing protein n=1 Tax=Candidatus Thiodictyon syntrophicum TaxID=1166950 RepID=A0A2K8UDN3_9GAMM|nr:Uma2 family endonuclease [Candidatus Thiodictyon syntrophicum]AUB83587.1 hypothetical protein THSYN_23325 [Candidatus Thiodictyon syntrophicum]
MSQTALAEPRRTRPEPAGAAPPSAAGRYVSEEEYWRDYYLDSDVHYEWNNGRLEEKPVSNYETFLVYQWFMLLLEHFLTARPIARMVALEMGFRLPLPTGTVIRKPDFGVVCNDNPQPLLPLDASYRGVFDLCVEALSDQERRDILRDTVVKKAEYAAGGVPEYYILHRAPEQQAFFTRTATGVYVPIAPDDGVIRSRVLPGLQFRVADLCRRPAHETLRDDPVYAAFVLPGWRAAEAHAAAQAQARREAEQAAAAQAQARQQAEQHAAAESNRADNESHRAAAEAQARRQAERRAQEAEQALARLQAQLAGRNAAQ